ncbi:YceD family protein [Citricoccus sp. NR2]|uniref:YceD family protein n=1 Tax=Citricoccus sp. NR2 TaxID=3004095 RepID=UPI0022DD972E|nr:DUF177 domain-containing protein [Citricoccus sp. NR2]WBL18573.1 DUF177 domain-containing protein [Citricoccus sp. NR2]
MPSTRSTSTSTTANPWILSVNDLVQSPGNMRSVEGTWPAPDALSVPLFGIQQGADVDVELRLESVHEGILVSGQVTADANGECSRCLDPLHETLVVPVQELFLYEPEGDEEDQPLVQRDTVDVEPVVRDSVVPSLPFQPVCRDDCQGLCGQCGIRLDEAPEGHHHEQVDPRWAALAAFASEQDTDDTGLEEKTFDHETEER